MVKKVEIAIVLDKSGSMQSIKKATIDGFNNFISDQLKNKIDARVTLAQFNHTYELVYQNVKLEHLNKLTSQIYVPGGTTALLDAIGNTINIIKEKHKHIKKSKRPENVIFVIITDGYENSSVKYDEKRILKK